MNELRGVLDTCSDSTPGPDGITYRVWRELWTTASPILLEAWNYSISVGKLPPSHKTSYLKLIPKLGKDLKKLTNWRPITLSNCDHKIFSKLYSVRIGKLVGQRISENQTAYLKGRLINDNVRSLIATINLASSEADIDAILVSLDAKKAFDSVEHSYIRTCLRKFGLENFLPIFDTLYSELRSDILINGRIVRGYQIKRGVKQGDALSCIIFIMCVEPLLRNLEKNNLIQPVSSVSLGSNLPKAYAYADDINCVIKNDLNSLQRIFWEYERLSRLSGLVLNADKTEIMLIRSNNVRNVINNQNLFRIRYMGDRHDINGIILCEDLELLKERNVDEVCRKINSQLKKWGRRNLSIIGKILITKTFGVSQLIYLLQSLSVSERHYKKLNHLLYKFIWNKHYLAAKAPERIKRDIVNKPITLGGLGMLDIRELDDSLKLKALGRLATSKHPMLSKLRDKLNLEEFFFPTTNIKCDEVITRGLELLKLDRTTLFGNDALLRDRTFIWYLRELKLKRILSEAGKASLIFYNLRRQGKDKLGQLNHNELRSLTRFVKPLILKACTAALAVNPGIVDPPPLNYYTGQTFSSLDKLTSKAIRLLRSDKTPINTFKLGALITPNKSLSWGLNVSKLTNTKHKDILLRLVHGELYSREQLYRYNLNDSPSCPRCGEIEQSK